MKKTISIIILNILVFASTSNSVGGAKSHSIELLRRFCLRGIVFSGGNLIFDGNIEEALDFYDKFYS